MAVAILSFLFILCFNSNASADGFWYSWGSINHRVYENGNEFNRFTFGIGDGSFDSVDEIEFAALVPPGWDGDEDNFSAYRDGESRDDFDFLKYEIDCTAKVDTDNRVDRDSMEVDSGSYYQADFADPLVYGSTYIFAAVDDTGREIYHEVSTGELLELPIVSSSSFEMAFDAEGNLVWSWDKPELDDTFNGSIRASIDGYNVAGELLGWLTIKTAVDVDFIILPNDFLFGDVPIFQDLNSIAACIQLRDSTGENRTYSNYYDFNTTADPVPEPATLILLGSGLLGLVGGRRPKIRKKA